ncbi:hypothetical protein ACFFHC_02365 [Kytococcus schroeteri]|uniref:hypothetical protein n=1 Tax=Kytococcus schroeteri TaxID=138300 RepID=UPI0035E841C2
MDSTKTFAVGTALLLGAALATPASAAPDDRTSGPDWEPLPITFEVGEADGQGERPWSVSVDGDVTQPKKGEDGLATLNLLVTDYNNNVNNDHPDHGPSSLGIQDDGLTGCQEGTPGKMPSGRTSEDESFRWVVDEESTEDNPIVDPEFAPGHYEKTQTSKLSPETRALEVVTVTCPTESDWGYMFGNSFFVRTSDTEFTRVATVVTEGTFHEGGESVFHTVEGWEFLEQLEKEERPDGMSDAEWADKLVAEGVVPADKRWYVANEEPPGEDDDEGPIVDTGVEAGDQSAAFAAGLAGVALLGAGGATVVAARRR